MITLGPLRHGLAEGRRFSDSLEQRESARFSSLRIRLVKLLAQNRATNTRPFRRFFPSSELQRDRRSRGCLLIRFPHANGFVCSDQRFIAHWIAWCEAFGPPNTDPLTAAMPRYASHQSLAMQVAAGRQFSVDVLARSLVPTQYRNTCQASQKFVTENPGALEACLAIGASPGRNVAGLRLTDQARSTWLTLAPQEQALELLRASATIEADLDIDIAEAAPSVLLGGGSPPTTPTALASCGADRMSLILSLAEMIHSDPFQAHYRLRPHGEPVVGWPNRLRSYFWPVPAQGFAETAALTATFYGQAAPLAAAIQEKRDWSDAEQASAICLAEAIFAWGGVTQSNVTAAKVRAAFENAIEASIVNADAPMNSGWTKVAAFATAHLEGVGRAQAIWDSRVSTSLVERLDALLCAAGLTSPTPLFPRVGLVRGRGGFRARRQDALRLQWPDGYGKWSAQFAGSALITELCATLNRNPDRFGPMPTGAGAVTGKWTVRGVEMVLFMDGY